MENERNKAAAGLRIRRDIPVIYDIDDVDGKMYMLDRRFSGCAVLQFTKKLDENIKGSVTFGQQNVPYVLTSFPAIGDVQFMGVFVRNICTEYGKEYVFHFEGFRDTEGNLMEPEDLTVATAPSGEPEPEYAADDEVALKAAEEGIVLLKNENRTLPLPPDAHPSGRRGKLPRGRCRCRQDQPEIHGAPGKGGGGKQIYCR